MASEVEKYVLKKYNIKTDIIEIPDVTRDDLAALFHELEYKFGAEIGVAGGDYSEVIMRNNPQLELMLGVDPYLPYKGYKDFRKLGTFDSLERSAHEKLDRYENYEFRKALSLDAAKSVADGTLDFVFIDANHSEPYVSQDIEAWTPKVRSGGIVSGHDYARIKGKGQENSTNWAVIPAIKKFTKENGYTLFIWGLEAKIPGLKREGSRSWMFIKP